MLTTLALVTIFSAILVFFSSELMAYGKKLTARPYVFLLVGLLILSTWLEMYPDLILSWIIVWWIGLLQLVQWLSHHLLGNVADQLLAKWVIVVVLSTVPVVWALYADAQKRMHSLYNSDDIKKRGYVIGLVFWLTSVLLFGLRLPGSPFSG
jgi:hypothetical protein